MKEREKERKQEEAETARREGRRGFLAHLRGLQVEARSPGFIIPKFSRYHLLPSSLCVSQKLESGVELKIWTSGQIGVPSDDLTAWPNTLSCLCLCLQLLNMFSFYLKEREKWTGGHKWAPHTYTNLSSTGSLLHAHSCQDWVRLKSGAQESFWISQVSIRHLNTWTVVFRGIVQQDVGRKWKSQDMNQILAYVMWASHVTFSAVPNSALHEVI